jgi:hypothetical protein
VCEKKVWLEVQIVRTISQMYVQSINSEFRIWYTRWLDTCHHSNRTERVIAVQCACAGKLTTFTSVYL